METNQLSPHQLLPYSYTLLSGFALFLLSILAIASILKLFVRVAEGVLLQTKRYDNYGVNDLCEPGYGCWLDDDMILDGTCFYFAKNLSTIFLYATYFNYILGLF